MQDVVFVDEGLDVLADVRSMRLQVYQATAVEGNYHKQCPHGVVDEDGSGCDEHAESYEAVELGGIRRVIDECEGERTILSLR
jgi:hypothetical protein